MTLGVDPVLLDEAQARFLIRHNSIWVGSCNVECRPSLARAYGCRLASDRSSITVFLAIEHSHAVLDDLRAGGAITVVFSRPTTHETLQLKGSSAAIGPLDNGDRALMRAYAQSFCDEIGRIGFNHPFTTAIMSGVEADAVTVTFNPTAAFNQTPGPSAGQPLGGQQ